MNGLKGVKYKAVKINLQPIDLFLPEIKDVNLKTSCAIKLGKTKS